MQHPEGLSQWQMEIARGLPVLSAAQAWALALWCFAMEETGGCGCTTLAVFWQCRGWGNYSSGSRRSRLRRTRAPVPSTIPPRIPLPCSSVRRGQPGTRGAPSSGHRRRPEHHLVDDIQEVLHTQWLGDTSIGPGRSEPGLGTPKWRAPNPP